MRTEFNLRMKDAQDEDWMARVTLDDSRVDEAIEFLQELVKEFVEAYVDRTVKEYTPEAFVEFVNAKAAGTGTYIEKLEIEADAAIMWRD